MARSRYIRPGYFENEELAQLDPLTRLFFQGLWCWADREGRLKDRPRLLACQILPYDDCDADRMLADLERAGFIVRYAIEGSGYLQVVHFDRYQKPHPHEPASEIPPPSGLVTAEHGQGLPMSRQSNDTGPALPTLNAYSYAYSNEDAYADEDVDAHPDTPEPPTPATTDDALHETLEDIREPFPDGPAEPPPYGERTMAALAIADIGVSPEEGAWLNHLVETNADADAADAVYRARSYQGKGRGRWFTLTPHQKVRAIGDELAYLQRRIDVRRKAEDAGGGVQPTGWQVPDVPEMPPATTDLWRAVQPILLANARHGFTEYFASAVDALDGAALVLTFPDDYTRQWAKRHDRQVSDALTDAGYPDTAVSYEVAGEERVAS